MKAFIFKSLIIVFTVFSMYSLKSQHGDQLYKVTLLRAAPGDLLALIDALLVDLKADNNLGLTDALLIRHSQGDQWDLMLIDPISSMGDYFSEEQRTARTTSSAIERPYGDMFHHMVSFQEEAFVRGPTLEIFQEAAEFQLFHIEIFTALAGKQSELLSQRKNENQFYSGIDHRPNLIFTRVMGPSWDVFTLGGYTDLHDFAGPAVAFEEEDAAAKSAGFAGVNFIGSYLRSLLLDHHDTLGKKVAIQ
jgi:hypothetical protein